VGRQPWTIYGLLRTADAVTPILATRAALISLVVYCALYTFIGAFGVLFIYRLLRAGPGGRLALPPSSGRARQVTMGDPPFIATPSP
jgi:cytochrome bd ubiquinol oxidase subunit I